jgi:hypothetical protein
VSDEVISVAGLKRAFAALGQEELKASDHSAGQGFHQDGHFQGRVGMQITQQALDPTNIIDNARFVSSQDV